MRITVNLDDALHMEARALAAREGTTLRALAEEGLKRVIAKETRKKLDRPRSATAGGKSHRP
jgi:hypothetical protein